MTWQHTLMAIGVHLAIVVGCVIAFLFVAHVIRQKRAPSTTMAWLLAILLIPYVAVPLYLLLGGRKRERAIKHKQALERLEVDADIHPVGAMQKLLDAYHCSLPLPNHSLSMLTDGVAGYRAVCGLIDSAQSSIDLATYVYRPDAVGLDILARLTARAQAGIRVRLLLDAVGAGKIKTNHLREFRAAGGKAAYFMPIFKGWKITRGDLRNHRKILAVDGVRVMAGGTNIADEYIGPTARADRWQDLSFLLEGPSTSVYQQIFESDWQFATGEQKMPDLTLPAIEPGEGQIVQVVPAGPDVAEDPLYDAFITAFYTAQERLWIVTPYFVPDQALMQSIETASRRGVDVRILVPKVSNQGLANLARGPYLRQLRDAGATIMQYTPGMMHAKILLVDHEFAMVGSCNLDLRSLLLNYEVAMFTYSPESIADVEEWVTGLMQDCEIGMTDPSSTRDFFENLTALIGPLL